MSYSKGDPAGHRHDCEAEYREGLANVDPDRTRLNRVLVDVPLEQAYESRFGRALAAYNEAKRAKGRDRDKIPDYLAHVRSVKQEEVYEAVIQIGNRLTNPASDPDCRALSEAIYVDLLDRLRQRFPHIDIVVAAIHMDEATPHMHIQYVPWSSGNKRGLETKNSLRGALRQMGFSDVREMNEAVFECMEEVAERHGVWRVDGGCAGAKHLDVRDFKAIVAAQEQEGYPYKNDPDLLAFAAQALACANQANEALADQTAALEFARDNAAKLSKGRAVARVAAESLERTEPARTALERVCEALRDALAGVKAFWKDFIVNPVPDALRRAREAFKRRVDDQEASAAAACGNESLGEQSAAATSVSREVGEQRSQRRAARAR